MRKVIQILLVLASNIVVAQTSAVFESAFGLGSTNSERGNAVAVDGSGNVYIAGAFIGTNVDFDPGPGTFLMSSNGTSNFDVFVMKLNSSGTLLWAKSFGSSSLEYPNSIAVDNAGNVYTTGVTESAVSVDFNPHPTNTDNKTGDIFTQKLDTNGDYLWTYVMGAGGTSVDAWSVLDGNNNLILAGYFQTGMGFPVSASDNTSALSFSGIGTRDAFAGRISTDGVFSWGKQFGSASEIMTAQVGVTSSGDVILSGHFESTVDFDPDAGTQPLTSTGTSQDGYILKLNGSNGSFVWVKQIAGTGRFSPYSVKTDGSGNIIIGGSSNGANDFDPGTATFNLSVTGTETITVLKLNATGDFTWVKAMTGPSQNIVRDMEVDTYGATYLTGSFQNTVDFNPNAGTTSITSTGSQDIFIQKLNPDGALVWAHKFGGTLEDYGMGMFIDGNFIHITGIFSASADFDPSTSTFTLTSAGGQDMFWHKLSNPVSTLNFDTQPVDASGCANEETSVSGTASGTTNIVYQWQWFNTATVAYEDVQNSAAYSGATTSSLLIEFAQGAVAGTYRLAARGDFVSPIVSNAITVSTIALPPAPTTSNIVGDDCAPQAYTLTATSPTAGEFRWYSVLNSSAPEAAETTGSHTTPLIASSITYNVAFFDGTCESTRVPATVTVNYDGPGSLDKTNFETTPYDPNYGGSLIDDFEFQSDGKVVVNAFELGATSYYFARLNADGTFDSSFPTWTGDEINGRVDVLEMQGDKIIAGGRFTDIDGTEAERIARFNADGSLDLTFNVANTSDFNNSVTALAVQPDGKIIVGGRFTLYNGATATRIVRLNANGTLDGSFTSSADAVVNSIVLRPDGKILIGGLFTSYNSTPISGIALLNTDGTLDGSFTPASVSGIFRVALQSDGKILITGGFTTVGGVMRNSIARLNVDGSLDTSFDPGAGPDDAIYAMHQDSNGKILVGGWFENFNGVNRNFIARLMPDGSIDPFFDAGIGPYTLVTMIKPATADRVFLAGYIDSWNREMFNGMGVVNNNCIRVPEAINNTSCTGNITISACGGSAGYYRWYTQPVTGGEIVGETNSSLSLTGLASTTTYYVSLKDAVCESARVPVVATITSSVSAPTTTNSSGCPGATQSVSASGGAAGQYRWYTVPTGGTAIAGETGSTYLTPVLSTSTVYYVSINDGTCESPRQSVTASVVQPPSAPIASNHARCGSGTVTLTASGGANGLYRWYTVASGGTAIAGETNGSYTTPTISATTNYYVAIHDGTCESTRTAITITINTPPFPPEAPNVATCSGSSATIVAAGAPAGQYRWYTVASGGSAISGETNGTYITPSLSTATTYYVSINNGACESTRTATTVTVNANPAAPGTANVTICSGAAATLIATGGSNGNYRWYTTSTGGSAIVGEVNSSYTTSTLTENTTYYVSLNVGGCESNRVAVQVTVNSCANSAPQIQSPSLTTQVSGSVTLNLLSIISDPDGNLDPSSLQIEVQPQSGAIATIDGSGNLVLDYSGLNFAGTDYLTIRVCDNLGSCTSQQLEIEVVGDIIVYNAISPNGDGVNDTFFIQYIDVLPSAQNNKVTIFNRWGDVVFDIQNYNNADKVFGGLNNNGNELPSGTYFYKIEYGAKELTGYLALKR